MFPWKRWIYVRWIIQIYSSKSGQSTRRILNLPQHFSTVCWTIKTCQLMANDLFDRCLSNIFQNFLIYLNTWFVVCKSSQTVCTRNTWQNNICVMAITTLHSLYSQLFSVHPNQARYHKNCKIAKPRFLGAQYSDKWFQILQWGLCRILIT